MAKQEVFFGINIDTGQPIKEFGELKRRTKELKKELDGTKIGSKRFNELRGEITKNQATIRRFNRSLRDTKSLATRVGQGMTNAFKRVGGVLVAAFAADQLIQYGKQLFNLSIELGKVTNQVEQLTELSSKNAAALANQAKALNQVYGVETQDVIKAATALTGQFGITFEEALNKINVGLATGLDNNGEFLKTLREYPALLSEVGLNADQTFAIINQAVTSGVYSDKGIDAIKEAGLRLRELTKPTQDALKAIGLSADTIQKELANGTTTVFDVVQKVSHRLNALPPQSAEVGKAIADIFGGPGEDAGLAFLQTLSTIDTRFESITESLSEYEQSQLNLVEAQTEFNDVVNTFFGESSAGWNNIKAQVISFAAEGLKQLITGFVDLINVFIELYNESSAFRTTLSTIGTVGTAVFKGQLTFIKNVISAFKTMGNVVSNLIDGDFSKITSTVTDGFDEIANRTKDFALETASNFKTAFTEEFTEKDKISLIDFSSETVKSSVNQSAKNAGEQAARSYVEAFRERLKIELELFPEEESRELTPAEGDQEVERQVGQISVLEQRLQQLGMVYGELQDSINQTSNAFMQLASIQEQGSEKQKKFVKASVRLKQLDAAASAALAIAELKAAFSKDMALGFPLNIVAVASTAAVLASSIATIRSGAAQLEQFQKGGIISGPSHAEGGVPVKMANGGMVEAEGGEAIINKKNTKLFAPVLSAINSYGGNGDKFERGGVISNGVPNAITTPSVTTGSIIEQLQSIDFKPTVSVVEINEAQTRITEIENNSTL